VSRWAIFVALVGTTACSTGSAPIGVDAGVCEAVATDCPATPPSWSNDVEPLITRYCWQCHGDGGIEQSSRDFSTYQGVYANRVAIQTQVLSCAMPEPDAGAQPTSAERQTIVEWVACGGPKN
jgi:hypothetical protein